MRPGDRWEIAGLIVTILTRPFTYEGHEWVVVSPYSGADLPCVYSVKVMRDFGSPA